MQRYVLRADDGSVTLLHPDTPAEYEQARAGVETSGGPNVEREPGRPGLTSRLAGSIRRRPAVEAKPGGSAGDDSATPAGEDGAATAETAGGGYYVVTTDSQRRAWGLPDLAKEAGARGTAPGDVDAAERHHAVPVVDPAEAMDLLFEDGGNESDGQDGDGRAIGVRQSVRPDAVPVVNLKKGRGPIPVAVRAAFRELCRQPRVDGVLELMDGAIGPLETAVVPELEEARRQLAALRREEVTPERLGDAGGAEGSDEAAERVARTCWVMRRRLGKVGDALDRLDFSGMDIETRPSSFRRLLQLVLELPWTARASERVDIEAAMAELDAAHAGRAAVKERVRRFLATRQLTSTTWTVEGLSPGGRSRGGAGSAPVARRRLVVRPARSAARAPVLCLAGPSGGGKTTLAKLIARALGRPGVLVALGGVWDESAVRGLRSASARPRRAGSSSGCGRPRSATR